MGLQETHRWTNVVGAEIQHNILGHKNPRVQDIAKYRGGVFFFLVAFGGFFGFFCFCFFVGSWWLLCLLAFGGFCWLLASLASTAVVLELTKLCCSQWPGLRMPCVAKEFGKGNNINKTMEHNQNTIKTFKTSAKQKHKKYKKTPQPNIHVTRTDWRIHWRVFWTRGAGPAQEGPFINSEGVKHSDSGPRPPGPGISLKSRSLCLHGLTQEGT